jgi:hypothetical protein
MQVKTVVAPRPPRRPDAVSLFEHERLGTALAERHGRREPGGAGSDHDPVVDAHRRARALSSATQAAARNPSQIGVSST